VAQPSADKKKIENKMKILAFDTTGENASVAILDEEKNIYRISSDDAMNHLKGLLPMTEQLFRDTGISKKDLTHIAVSVGPGSFTGIRIGIATAKTLAQALGLPVIPVSTLASFTEANSAAVLLKVEAAQDASDPAIMAAKLEDPDCGDDIIRLICPLIDARREQVFAAAFTDDPASAEPFCESIAADAYKVEEFVQHCFEYAKEKGITEVVFYGNGCDSYRAVIDRVSAVSKDVSCVLADESIRYQDASYIAILGAKIAEAGGACGYNEVQPVYLRKAEAERKLAAKQLGVKKKDKEPQVMVELPPVDEVIGYRFAEVKDIPAFAKLDAVCFSRPWSEASFEGDMTGPRGSVYVAAENSKSEVIGFAGITYILDEGEVNRVAVNPLYRGRGIGDKMMDMLLAEIESKGVTEITLEVREANRSAIALYKNHGFKVEGKRNNYYAETGENALIMWKHAKTE